MNMMHTNTAHTNLTRTNMTHTNITHTTTLSRKEQEDIRRISALCRLTDGLSLSCPEDGDVSAEWHSGRWHLASQC